MANVFPFKGWRYNREFIADLSSVFVPPYDVITAEEQVYYYSHSPYNYIRINLNRGGGDNRYTAAAKYFAAWKKDAILIKETEPAIYILSQSFTHNGKKVDRVGCICALELSKLGEIVLPHEQTIEKHIEDRYKLMDSTQVNSGQIFMCYQDEQLVLEKMYNSLKTSPHIDCILDEIRYQIWPVTEPILIKKFKACLSGKHVVIADGHHRYRTALRYFRNNPNQPSAERVMVTLVNSSNPGMNVLPTHRLLTGVNTGIEQAITNLKSNFKVEKIHGLGSLLKELEKNMSIKGQMGIYHRESDIGLLLNFIAWDKLKETFPDQSKTSRELNTNIMHTYIMKNVFGVDTNNQQDLGKITYMRGNKPVLDLLMGAKNFDVACFVQPPTLNEIFAIAQAGETMPQKSTFFFPKVYSGLVTRYFGK